MLQISFMILKADVFRLFEYLAIYSRLEILEPCRIHTLKILSNGGTIYQINCI